MRSASATGRPGGDALVFPAADRAAWTKDDWDVFRANGWKTACKRAGLVPAPRPYDLRHSFASLLLAEGERCITWLRSSGTRPS